tara:strand:+ start:1298 stop:1912 length:615 start_codon:yes stop_codon:yes gene_type:complete
MNLKYYYYYFKKALTPRFCDEIIKFGLSQQDAKAQVGGQIGQHKKNKKLEKIRNSNVSWLNDKWIYKEIQPFIHQANQLAGWNFDWDFSESCQFTKYKLNQFYDWHCDSWKGPLDTPKDLNSHGKIRKLSVTCSLSDPKDYKGGELEFDFRNNYTDKKSVRKCAEIKQKGSVVVFPSHLWHRVKPVTKGTRYSLVMWNLGYPFK